MRYNPDCKTPVCFLTADSGKEEERSLGDVQVCMCVFMAWVVYIHVYSVVLLGVNYGVLLVCTHRFFRRVLYLDGATLPCACQSPEPIHQCVDI
jgi:hypothetical protein